MFRKYLKIVLLLLTPATLLSEQTLTQLSREAWEKAVPVDVRSRRAPVCRYDPGRLYTAYYRLDGPSSSDYLVLEALDQLDLIELHYRPDGSDQWISSYGGDQIPMARRDLPQSSLILPVERKGEASLYIKMQDYQLKRDIFKLTDPKDFFLAAGRRDTLLLFSYGLILIMAFYNLMLFHTSRKPFYLFYALVMICLNITLLGKHRYWSFLVAQNQPYGYFIYVFFNSLAVIGALFFARYFFNLSWKSPMGRIFQLFASALAVVALLAFAMAGPGLGDVMNIIIIPSLISLLAVSVRMGIKGDRASKIILASFIPIILAVFLDNMTTYLDFEWYGFEDLFQALGTVAHIIIINYGMAVRQAGIESEYSRLRNEFHRSLEEGIARKTREVEESVLRDPLTRLYSRVYLNSIMEELEERRGDPVGIIFADLDNFKYYNDTFGHNVGDTVLIRISRFLESHVREKDLIFRFGGDEFLILMPGTQPDVAGTLGARLHQDFQELSRQIWDEVGDSRRMLGISLGFFGWDGKETLWDAVCRADQALIKAKKKGKNRILHFT